MASFSKRGDRWRAQIRHSGQPTISMSFPNKAQAQRWARKVEGDMDRAAWEAPALLADKNVSWLTGQYREARTPGKQQETTSLRNGGLPEHA